MRLQSFVAAAVLLTASLAAHAESITQTFSETFSVSSTTDVTNLSLQQFNPGLGVLTSVSGTLSGSALVSAGSPLEIYVNDKGSNTLVEAAGFPAGDNTFSVSGSLKDASDLIADTGLGLAPFTLHVDDSGSASGSVTGSVTYNYTPIAVTPVAATPEPSSLALLGTGLLGALGVARKRFA